MRISNPGYFYDLNNRFTATKSEMLNLQLQISTGERARDLAGVGFEVKKYINFESATKNANRYIENIEKAETRLTQTITIFETIQTVVNDVQGMLKNTTTSTEPTASQMVEFAEKSFDLLEDLLNTQAPDGGRVLGGYTRFEPISFDMFDAAPYDYNGGDPFPINVPIPLAGGDVPGDIPYYITNKTPAPTLPGPADSDLQRDSVQVSDVESIAYSATPYEEEIQKVVYALDIARKALDSMPTVAFETSVSTALQYLEEAELSTATATSEAGLPHAIREAEVSLLRLHNVKERHQSEINFFEDVLVDLDGVETTEAATKLASLQTQLEASFSTTATLKNLSLLEFLSF